MEEEEEADGNESVFMLAMTRPDCCHPGQEKRTVTSVIAPSLPLSPGSSGPLFLADDLHELGRWYEPKRGARKTQRGLLINCWYLKGHFPPPRKPRGNCFDKN